MESRPGGRAVDAIAVSSDRNRIRQLASCREIARNVPIIRCGFLQMNALPDMWIEHKHGFTIMISHCLYGTSLIRIAGHHSEAIRARLCGIYHERDRKIDIGLFLFELDDTNASALKLVADFAFLVDRWHQDIALSVEAVNHVQFVKVRQSLKIDILAFDSLLIVRVGLDICRKVFHRQYLMLIAQQCAGEGNGIKPLVRSSFEKSVIKVVSINIDYCFLHSV